MNKKSLLLLLTFAISCCTSLNKLDYYKEVDLSSIVSIGDKLSVTLNSGDNYYLKVVSIKDNQMVGTLLETSEGITITVDDIEYIEVETIDGSKTTLAIMGGIVLIPFGIKNSPYADEMLDDGIIKYEGHDQERVPKELKKSLDQPIANKSGTLTQNGKFLQAAEQFKEGKRDPAKIKVYRKIRAGVWVDMGFYDLIDGSIEHDGKRNVFKFLLKPNFKDFKPEESDNVWYSRCYFKGKLSHIHATKTQPFQTPQNIVENIERGKNTPLLSSSLEQ